MNLLMILLCLPLVFMTPSVESRRGLYGEACNKTYLCDRRAWLGCVNETCTCLMPDEMFYEPSTNMCVSRAGERCKFTLENVDGSIAFDYTACTGNSLCGLDGFCSCIEDFLEAPNGTCVPTRKYLETCDEHLKCSSLSGFECEDGTCRCKTGSTFCDAHNHCVGLAGQDCIRSECTHKASCDAATNKCVCWSGFFVDDQDKCSPKVKLLNNCTNDDQCDQRYFPLRCIEGLCNCNSNVSVLQKGAPSGNDYPDAVCVGKADSPCIAQKCVLGAICRRIYGSTTNPWYPWEPFAFTTRKSPQFRVFGNFEESIANPSEIFGSITTGTTEVTTPTTAYTTSEPEGLCECSPGFSMTKAKTCGKLFGTTCSKNECMEPLVCSEAKCRCRYPHEIYSPFKLTCLSKVQGPCNATSDCYGKTICSIYNGRDYGECVCREGFVPNVRRECDVAYRGDCRINPDCDSVARLVCIDGRCNCPGFERFSSSRRKCLGLVGGACECDTSGVSSDDCVENASCSCLEEGSSGLDSDRTGTCVCNDGFSVSPEYACEMAVVESKAK